MLTVARLLLEAKGPFTDAAYVSALAAVSGYPSITLPMGQVHGMPVGLSIFGARFSEPVLIEIASGFEHRAGGFVPPADVP